MLNAKATRTTKKKRKTNTVETNKQKEKAIGLKVMLHGKICNDDF